MKLNTCSRVTKFEGPRRNSMQHPLQAPCKSLASNKELLWAVKNQVKVHKQEISAKVLRQNPNRNKFKRYQKAKNHNIKKVFLLSH